MLHQVIWSAWLAPAWPAALGHLGHLGHGFKLQAWPCMLVDLGSFGSFILHDPNDLKHGHARHAGAKALGHLGHLVIDLKLAPVATLAWPYSLLGINPYIKIFYLDF